MIRSWAVPSPRTAAAKLEQRFGWNAVALQVEELLAVTQAC